MIRLKVLFSFFIVFLLLGCSNDPLKIDADNVQVKINFINADSLFVNNNAQKRWELNKQFGQSFQDLYLFTYEKGLKINTRIDTTFINQLNQFYGDSYIKDLEKEIKSTFNDLSQEKSQSILAFKHLRYHFPKMKLPKNVVFFNSLFTYNAIASPNDIGVGLEWYLGENKAVIQKVPAQNIYDYMKQGMNRKFMVRDIVYQWIYSNIQAPLDAKFAEDMVSWGKLLYCIEAALPNEDKAIICRYSPEKFQWAEKNEKNIWKFFVEQKLLFQNDELLKLGYFNEAPFTKGLPKESPDRLGQYIGWKMVRKYVEKHDDITIEKLLKVPYAEIMQSYKID
jgi:hypothetical protein